jgi:HlyD family secretion protein
MKRKILIPAIILLVLAGGVAIYRATIKPHSMVITGIVATNDVIVSAQIQGQLAQLLVKEGDTVQAGQLVAVIEPEELRADKAFYAHTEQGTAAQVQQAEAELQYQEKQTRDQIRQAEAALASTQAQQAEAEADLELDRVNLERTEGLFKQSIVSAQSLDQARATYDAQKAHVESLRKQVDAQRAAVALAHSNEDQITVRRNELLSMQRQLAAVGAQKSKAQVRLNYTEIRAPIPGFVASLPARQGEVVSIAQPILEIINPDDLWVRVDVEETYIDRVHLGEKMRVRLPSGAEREGTVFYRGVDADYATQRDVGRTKRDIKTFEFRLRVDNSDRSLWPGLTAYVDVPLPEVR